MQSRWCIRLHGERRESHEIQTRPAVGERAHGPYWSQRQIILKTGGKEGLKGSKCLRDVKTNMVKGSKEGLKRGGKRKAKEVLLKEIVKRTKPLKDIFGE